MHAALEEFWRRGYQAVSVSDLAQAMSISRTSFYNSFQDRDAVFREALEAYRELAPDSALREIAPGAPVVPAVRKVFQQICRVRARDTEARGCLIINSIGEIHNMQDQSRAYLETAADQTRQVFEDLLRRAVEQGEIAGVGNPEAAGCAFMVFLIGLNEISKVIRSEAVLFSICDEFLRRYGF